MIVNDINIKGIIKSIRLSGQTIKSIFFDERKSTELILKKSWKKAVLNETPSETFFAGLDRIFNSRKRSYLTMLKNVFSATRGKFRSIKSTGKRGYWENVGIFDSNQTIECGSYMGATWHMPYSQIPNPPPRISNTPHPCRSWLNFVEEGENPINQEKFITQFNNSGDDIKKELLGKNRFEAWKKGEIEIKSFSQYERTQLFTLKELGLED